MEAILARSPRKVTAPSALRADGGASLVTEAASGAAGGLTMPRVAQLAGRVRWLRGERG